MVGVGVGEGVGVGIRKLPLSFIASWKVNELRRNCTKITNCLQSPRAFFAVYPESPQQQWGPFAVVSGRYKAHYYTKGSRESEAGSMGCLGQCPGYSFQTYCV